MQGGCEWTRRKTCQVLSGMRLPERPTVLEMVTPRLARMPGAIFGVRCSEPDEEAYVRETSAPHLGGGDK